MDAILLTIVTISKDDEPGLERTRVSCKPLTSYPQVEQIIVAGGNSNGSPDLDLTGNNVRRIERQPQGIADAFNVGLSQARGEWIWFLNGGDCIASGLDAAWLISLLTRSRADILIGGIVYGSETGYRPHPSPALRWPPFRSWIPHPATLTRRLLFDRFGNFDAQFSIAMDFEWWLRATARDVSCDVLSVPFTVFAPGGISEQSEFKTLLVRERDRAIRRHQTSLWRTWVSQGYRLTRASICALFSR